MRIDRKGAIAFRPSLDDSSLETRLVLSTGRLAMMAHANAGTAIQTHLVLSALRNQNRAAANHLRGMIDNQVAQLFANGTPTAQQRADFNAQVSGEVLASAFQLSSQDSLLPGSTRLVSRLQGSLLGNAPNSFLTRVQNLSQSPFMGASSMRLQNAMTRQLNASFGANGARLNNFLATTPINRLSVNQARQRIPLQQFMGSQIVNQLGNTLGSLAQSFNTNANSSLFANGVTTATPANQIALLNQTGNALGTAAFQLGSDVALFPFNSRTVGPGLQSALFANTPTSLFNQLQSLPNINTAFNTAASTAFNNGFTNLVTPLNSFFNVPTTAQTLSLPTSAFTNVIGPSFNNIANGFSDGFGSGFMGFGTAPTTFNTNFGTGFNGFVTTMNASNGFSVPTVNTLPTGVIGTTTSPIGTVGTTIGTTIVVG
jgi:hypothetical protein